MANLQATLEQKKNEIGLVGTRLSFSQPEKGRGISEHITHDWKEIVIKVRKDLNLVPDKETRNYLEKVGIKDPLEILATDLLYHGCGHRELPTDTSLGCPHTVQHHDDILDGITKALKKKKKQGLEAYVANAFEDILDNANTRKHTRHAGQILFWNNEGLENEGKFQPFYEAFVKINLLLWGCPEDASLLKRFFTGSQQIKNAVAQFKDYLQSQLGAETLVRIYAKEELFKELFNKKHWNDIAYHFAYFTADLLEQPQMRLCFGVPEDGESPFDKLIKIPDIQEQLVYERYKAGKGPAEHSDPVLQLDSLYRRISKSISVKTTQYTQSTGIPVAFYGKRDIREDEIIKPKQLKGLGFNSSGELCIKVARHDLKYPATYKVHPRNFPRLKVALVDTSGSMAEAPNGGNVGSRTFIPWGDNSKYHYALKGLYGIDNFLQKQGIANYVKSEAITFSSSTRKTGKRELRSMEERLALLRAPSGGTTLDVSLLQSEVSEQTFLISISDGDIANWGEIRGEYANIIKGVDYCHLHIGTPNVFTQDLESWGVQVHYVHGNDDLSRIMIDTAAKYYRGFAK